jgi:hypothetical protein
MTKSKKAMIAGAALAGLLAGTGSAVQASNVVAGARAAATHTQDQSQKDTKVKEKHACKGQNSCKGKGFVEMSKADCTAAKAKAKEAK